MSSSAIRTCESEASVLDAGRIGGFLDHLVGLGHAPRTVAYKRRFVTAFARWAARRRIDVARLHESHVDAFLRDVRLARPRHGRGERITFRAFLAHLRAHGKIPEAIAPEPTPAARLLERYESYLRLERGIAADTARHYAATVRDFIAVHAARPAEIGVPDVREYLLARRRDGRTPKFLTVVLRSLLRFLFLRDETATDLSLAVPRVVRYRLSSVPRYVAPETVETILDVAGRDTTAVGRRDHAVLLVLARLGLRSGEVRKLELGDLRWRVGEIVVRGKMGHVDRLPLPPDVGAALAAYLREARPSSASRRVFLRVHAPYTGLSQGAISHIVQRALDRAAIARPPLRGPYLFRHSFATTMVRRGASMAEVGEVLRHRSAEATAVYAKVDFEALREIALPWPVAGGVR